ncbi:MAG: tRNA (adenosine(37)-N6)-dimethylallyltransferase MiaA [Ignavibacteriaceae bacterium]
MKYDLITILGSTAVGKTNLAAKLAFRFDGEIISADSRQVYKGMNIGTGKDYNDYFVNGQKVNYHLIDIVEPYEEFNLFLFKENFIKSFDYIKEKGKLPFLVGGSGLYLSSALQKYKLQKADFESEEYDYLKKLTHEDLKNQLKELNFNLHNTTDLTEKERTIKAIIIEKTKTLDSTATREINSLNIGIKLSRDEIKARITKRLNERLDAGMVDEVKKLIDLGIDFERLNFFGLEYKYIGLFLKGECSFNDMKQKLNSAIHNFAKRQMTWFRKMEREGTKINWIDGPDYESAVNIIKNELQL